ncbi:GIY-YIG nuclease family protein [Rummeliibacillus stabekisii]|uniref:GIY-YIG nuclease family protein n=1 Tax=Rummeliibacillus stabekisii TaxID=241244 RepID=UPI00371CA2EE
MKKVGVRELVSRDLLELPAPFSYSDVEIREGIGVNSSGVYLFKTAEGQPLYVGITDNLSRRIYQHMTGRGNKDLYRYSKNNPIELEVYLEENLGYKELYESYLILLLNPRYNISKVSRKRLC